MGKEAAALSGPAHGRARLEYRWRPGSSCPPPRPPRHGRRRGPQTPGRTPHAALSVSLQHIKIQTPLPLLRTQPRKGGNKVIALPGTPEDTALHPRPRPPAPAASAARFPRRGLTFRDQEPTEASVATAAAAALAAFSRSAKAISFQVRGQQLRGGPAAARALPGRPRARAAPRTGPAARPREAVGHGGLRGCASRRWTRSCCGTCV